MVQNSVLLVDDDAKLVKLLKIYFEKDGFIAYTAADGIDALMAVRDHRPDILVLDLMMPGIDGWEVCRRLRKDNDIPIIMLTARDEESDRLVGLELGADDYVTKPFSPKEVVARAKAILRRTNRAVLRKEAIKIGGLTIDMDSYQVSRDGQVVELTPTEFKIVELLATNPGKVYSRLQIAEQVHGYTFEGYERTIDAHIKNLRRKLEANPKEPVYIQTVYGMGYKLAGVAKDE
ncbi:MULTISPECIES: response regulator transcription factor [Sporomusa]|uniref:DNA-binding response regulator, OmpR family, contains REC and winged-helix (WHTH) domain n=1 Tax=Sporomusa malonica TaxID=112901 RepID=A0A1W1Z7D6_9FIRM|nr:MULTISPECIES: response regulator transcription factor [Sporomusa]MCM0759549.1 response regulator transcription factor [Sporomusa sphaeroides DSM 2875]SMC44304.1 DNA-binding response regulator, OmpR family, contains REC and winged-helix (wHTH) domain [Sporomusa malonica]